MNKIIKSYLKIRNHILNKDGMSLSAFLTDDTRYSDFHLLTKKKDTSGIIAMNGPGMRFAAGTDNIRKTDRLDMIIIKLIGNSLNMSIITNF